MTSDVPWESDPRKQMEVDDSTVEMWFPKSNVVCTRIKGHFHHAFARRLMIEFDSIMATGQKITVWHDWGDATGFDTKVKVDFTAWAMKRSDEIERVHVFAESTFLRLAIKVSNLATNNRMRVYDARSVFRRIADESLGMSSGPTRKAL